MSTDREDSIATVEHRRPSRILYRAVFFISVSSPVT